MSVLHQYPQYLLFGFPGLLPRQNGVTLTPPTKKRATQSLQNPLKNIKAGVRERERERERERGKRGRERERGKEGEREISEDVIFPEVLEGTNDFGQCNASNCY